MASKVTPIGYASANMDVLNSAVSFLAALGFSSTQIGAADEMHITVYDSDASYTYSGVDPTIDGTGHYVDQDTDRVIQGNANIKKFRIIGITGTANIFVTLSSYNPVTS